MNLMHRNTANISHLLILTWLGMTPSLTSHGSVNDIFQHFSLNSFLVLSFDTKMSGLRDQWKILRASQCYGNLPFASINVSLIGRQYQWKHFPWIFPHANLSKILLHSMYQKMVEMLGLYIVYLNYIPHFKFYRNFGIHNFTIKCC